MNQGVAQPEHRLRDWRRRLAGQFAKYGSVAALSALADWVIFIIIFESGLGLLYAQGVARVVGGVVSFGLNRSWSFRAHAEDGGNQRRLGIEARRFLILYVVSYVLSLVALYLFVQVLGVWAYTAKILVDGLCFVFNFVVMRLYVFNAREGLSAGLIGARSRRTKPLRRGVV